MSDKWLNYTLTFFYVFAMFIHRKYSICEVSNLEQVYIDTAKMLKAMSDPKRLRIVDMLSCGELCACVILESFHITQPTLSHDMKVLVEAGIVSDRREGKNTYYSLNKDILDQMQKTLGKMFEDKPDCICHTGGECCK